MGTGEVICTPSVGEDVAGESEEGRGGWKPERGVPVHGVPVMSHRTTPCSNGVTHCNLPCRACQSELLHRLSDGTAQRRSTEARKPPARTQEGEDGHARAVSHRSPHYGTVGEASETVQGGLPD